MIEPSQARHEILHKDVHAYSAHPHIVALADGQWLVVFNKTIRRRLILHPPQDPEFRNWLIRSPDQGRSWSSPEVAPNYDWHGVECAGLTPLGGQRVMLNQWRFHWYPLSAARKRNDATRLVYPARLLGGLALSPELELDRKLLEDPDSITPWARGGGASYVHFSDDGGQSWVGSQRLETMPYSGGYGMRGGVVLAGDVLLLPLTDVPNYRILFILRSIDGGRSWDAPIEVARQAGSEFEEPALIRLTSGSLLMLMRDNGRRVMHRSMSHDDGRSWSAPQATEIRGYPPHLLQLPDGRLLCTYGWREPDYAIRAAISSDEGRSWDIHREIVIRGGLPNKDLGYPCSIMDTDGSIFTVYYGQDRDGVTCIMATRWRL